MPRWAGELIMGNPVLRRKAKQWCWDNGLDPNLIPIHGTVEYLEDDQIEVMLYSPHNRETRYTQISLITPIPQDLLE